MCHWLELFVNICDLESRSSSLLALSSGPGTGPGIQAGIDKCLLNKYMFSDRNIMFLMFLLIAYKIINNVDILSEHM